MNQKQTTAIHCNTGMVIWTHTELEKLPSMIEVRPTVLPSLYKPFIGFWQPRKAGLNKHTEKSWIHKIHKITSLEMI